MAQTQTGEGAGTNVLDVLDQKQPKGHSVEEITRIFDREAERGVLASAAADSA
jgi:hypothetical protein